MQQVFHALVATADFVFGNLLVLNLIFAVVIVFFQRKDPKTVWSWLLLLYFIPVLGFAFYLFLGADMHKRKMFKGKEIEDRLHEMIRRQEKQFRSETLQAHAPDIQEYSDLVMYNLDTTGAVLTDTNDIDIFTEGNDKFAALISDIEGAEKFIHIQYYIIKDDVLFWRIRDALAAKAAQGVEVRLLFDGMGCRHIRKKVWKKIRESGINTAEFFPMRLRRLHLRINYRNHRKIVVIDNKVAYVGGFNIGKEYISLDDKFGYWRDTHLRICGEGVAGLQLRFLLDWNYASGENLFATPFYMTGFEPAGRDFCKMQIIFSGPDASLQSVRDNYVQLIHKAKKTIYIQTPYFIPDEPVYTALMIALRSGVEVSLMIPCKPDHMFVYWATCSYMGELLMAGADCYIYNKGFLHAKAIMIDNKMFSCGTANMDIRSFALNFEVNAVVYDEAKTEEMVSCFERDKQHCTKMTKEMYAVRSVFMRIREQVSRLLSPLL